MWQERVAEFVTLWVVIDPIGTLPVFLAVTAHLTPAERKAVAIRAVLIALGVLVAFILLGQVALAAMGVSLRAFQLAGSVVLFLFALSMIFGPSKPEQDRPEPGRGAGEIAAFPLAIPSIAGPGAMLAVVVLTDDARHDHLDQAMTTIVLVVVLAILLALLLLANPIQRLIGQGGAAIVSRVMGMVLASVAVTSFVGALAEWLKLPPL